MSESNWTAAVAAALAARQNSRTLRQRRPVRILDSTHVQIDGQRLINFASNNYLGLTHHPVVQNAFEQAAKKYGVGSGAAPLITGHTDAHASAESAIANWKATQSAVLVGSGYVANLAAVQMLVSSAGPVRFLIDKLAHASLIDAVRSVSPNFRVFPHNHIGKLRRLLLDADPAMLQVVVTESIFSMDGDPADLPAISALKTEFPFFLLLDEAHGSGVYGPHGSGYANELGLANAVDLTIVTLSKAIGCVGGAICGSKLLCDAVVNFGRPYVFSTALPPAIAAAAEAAIGVMRDEPDRQQKVRNNAAMVRSQLPNMLPTDSPIIPIVLGNEQQALDIAQRLQSMGILVPAVRPPTVPRGTSRLRVTVSCDHSAEEIQQLMSALNACGLVVKPRSN